MIMGWVNRLQWMALFLFQNGRTPLMFACHFGHEKVVEALLVSIPKANTEAVDQVVSLCPCL